MSSTQLVSAPWATPDDLPPDFTLPPLPMSWDEMMMSASEILFELTGRQWRGEAQSRVQFVPGIGSDTAGVPGWESAQLERSLSAAAALTGWHGGSLLKLPSSPVVSVDEVMIGTTVLPASGYRVDRAGILERVGCGDWPCDESLFVTYTHGIAPPVGGRRAAAVLAVELGKAAVGDSGCRLRNVQTITREGVSMSAINLREALATGMTGLYEVDLWIFSVNPQKLKSRAKAWTPDLGRSRRVSTELTP